MERKTPGYPRTGERDRFRRALAAVAVSAVVAIAVAFPAARRMSDPAPSDNGIVATTAQPTPSTTEPAESTVPAQVLSNTTIDEGP